MTQLTIQHNIAEIDKVHFFGNLYSFRPAEFEFNRGDEKLIFKLVEHVKKLIETDEDLAKFADKKNKSLINNMFKTPFGVFFGSKNVEMKNSLLKSNANNETQSLDLDADTKERLEKDLFQSFKAMIQKFKLQKTRSALCGDNPGEIREDMVSVLMTKNSVAGHLKCAYCSKKGEKQNSYRVYHDAKNHRWVLTNFWTHLQRCHPKQSKIQLVDPDEPKKQTKASAKSKSLQQSLIEAHSFEAGQPQPHTTRNIDRTGEIENDSSFEMLESASGMLDASEQKIYFQISQQVTDMLGAKLLNKEDEVTFAISLDETNKHQITVSTIPADGSCLFGSIVHQLNHYKIGSPEHKVATIELRKDVVNFIKKDFPFFMQSLKDRVKCDDKTQIEKKCRDFVARSLSKDNCWGSTETILAVSRMLSVNIIVFDACGPCYLRTDFDFSYNKCLLIAYSSYGQSSSQCLEKNHYDSVTGITQKNIYHIMKNLVNGIQKKESKYVKIN